MEDTRKKYTIICVATREKECRKIVDYFNDDARAIERARTYLNNRLPEFHEVIVFRGSKCIYGSALS